MQENEIKWAKRLERCLKDMPDTLELTAGLSRIDVFPAGTISKCLLIDGDMDNPENHADDYYSILEVNITGCESQT